MKNPENREQWVTERISGIGGSDAAAVIGLSPYKTNVELWEEKTGRRKPKDISNKKYVHYGKEAEKYLRGLFSLDFPQYEIQYDEFKMYSHPEFPWLFATLDGALINRQSMKRGIVEFKTTEILRSGQYQQWNRKIPQHYYIQVLHQLLATNFSFVIVYALIKMNFGSNPRSEIRYYLIQDNEVLEDKYYLLKEEIKFWNSVEEDRTPNLILPAIN